MKRIVLSSALLSLFVSLSAWAQETRGTIIGTVQDGTGASIPGATVVITNKGTNTSVDVVTNERGYFEVPYLMPGSYSILVKAPSFKQTERSGVNLATGQRLRVDIALEVGPVNEILTVEADATILDTASASGGSTLSARQVEALPVFGDAAQLLARSVPGTQWLGQPTIVDLHSNMGASTVSAAGGVGGVEYALDGVPNLGRDSRVASMPPIDAVEEIRVDTAAFDASKGHTGNATISLVTKSGTNDFHGSVNWEYWNQRWNATPSTTNAKYWGDINSALAKGDTALADKLRAQERQLPGHNNSYAATLGGPLQKDKLFFFATFNGYQKTATEESTAFNRTVPSEAHRRGDFSDLLALGSQYQIYDPRTARLVNGVVVRDPFPNNQVPILNPVYNAYAALYPLPNNTTGTAGADGANNYLATGTPWTWKYTGFSNRFDWTPSGRHRFYAKVSYYDWTEDRTDWTYETARQLSTRAQNRHNEALALDWVFAANSSTILNVDLAYNRYRDGDVLTDKQKSYTPSGVGFPAYVDEKAGQFAGLPRINFTAYDNVGYNVSNASTPSRSWYDTASLRADLTKIVKTHSLKVGIDLRRYSRATYSPGNASGTFNFRNDYVKQTENTSNAATRGLEWAAFMLGVPSSVSIDTNDSLYLTNPALGAYFQDDWRVTSKLTLNIGVRYEYEGGFTERYNRGLAQFDPTATLPITAGAQAAYARILPTLSAAQAKNLPSSIAVVGGSRFLNADGWPKTLNDGQHAVMPRLGAVYQLTDKTVVRAGYGLFYATNNVLNQGLDQSGFSVATSTTLTNDRGLTFNNADLKAGRTIMSDPFPAVNGSRFIQPLGSTLGLMQVVGGAWDYLGRDWKRARQQRFRAGIQQELTRNMSFEVAYLGARADDISLVQRLNPLPEQYWASGNARNDVLAADLNQNIANPFALANFAGLKTSDPVLYANMATRGFYTATTIKKSQLLRAYPQMSAGNGVRNTRVPAGETKYDHIEATLTKRFAGGASFILSYTRAWAERRDWYANEFDADPSWTADGGVAPHHFMVNAVVEAPFGKDKRFFKSGILAAVLGGWRLGGIYHWQTGSTYDFGNLFWYGDTPANPLDPNDPAYKVIKLDNVTRERWFNLEPFLLPAARAKYPDWATNPASLNAVIAATNAARPADFHRRVFPLRFDFLRGDVMSQVDLSLTRRFALPSGLKIEARADVINLLNTVQWRNNPNTSPYSTTFGQATEQWNTPRWITLKARLTF
jgi:hypothetical protein